MIYFGWFSFSSVKSVIAFTFFRRDFKRSDDCITANVLKPSAYYAVIILDYAFATVCLVVNYFILAAKLKKSSRNMKSLTNSTINKDRVDVNTKLTRVNMITLGIFLALYMPGILLSCVVPFLPKNHEKYTAVIMNYLLLMFFLNNVINPFIYYFVLGNFREGYKTLLTCGRYKTRSSSERPVSTRITTISSFSSSISLSK